MKKKMLIVALIAVVLAVCAGGTYAYFVAEEPSYNVITTNGVSIELVEMQEDGTEFPVDTAVAAMPGVSVSKIVTVKALDAECWVRITLNPVFLDAEGNDMGLAPEEIGELVNITLASDKWQAEDDGWLYYADSLTEGEETEPFFEEVEFSPDMGNEYQECSLVLTIEAEAVQTANNGSSATDAVWN